MNLDFKCECLDGCPFFNDEIPSQHGVSEMIKRNFCRKDNRFCARYIVFKALGKPNVPKDLAPQNIQMALEMVKVKK